MCKSLSQEIPMTCMTEMMSPRLMTIARALSIYISIYISTHPSLHRMYLYLSIYLSIYLYKFSCSHLYD